MGAVYEISVVEEVAVTAAVKGLESQEWEVASSRSSHGGGQCVPAEVWEVGSDMSLMGVHFRTPRAFGGA